MPISLQNQTGTEQQMLQQLTAAVSTQLRVAMPGIVQSFDADAVTCVVQPAIRCSDGLKPVNLPLLVDVPVSFQRGGGVTLTFPIAPGDECLVVFADRCIDFWWQSGGIQDPVDQRMHDIADAFAIVGPQSQVKKIGGISTTAAQLRTDDGAAFVEVSAGHDITVKTPGKLTATADGGTEITSPTIVLNGAVTINGPLVQGQGDAGGDAKMNGPLTVTQDVTAGGISQMKHRHTDVDPGDGTSGGPI
ncbi:Gp138 family membrane-puncturing spike protein [Leminorella grimontii]|uniref:Gp138 family membrane-puncturing spike protein n=1 Tax=Leminorella grimontii TaxID=82981 RepID=UPI00322063BB